jgi:RNA polymerase sigma-70 factor (family 1)
VKKNTPNIYQAYTDFDLVALIKSDDVLAFESLYSRYFGKLYNHAYEKLHDRFLAQEVVQDLFVKFWQNRHKTEVHTSLASYFFVAIRYLIINQFKKQLVYEQKIDNLTLTQHEITDEINEWLDYKDLQAEYQVALQQLPEKCREVFLMSRNGAANKEIAEALNISTKTVEQHITKALRTLRILLHSRLNTLTGAMLWAISLLS